MVTAMTSGLLDLDERAGKILWMQEQHRLAVRADFRLAVAEHPCALLDQPVARRNNIRYVVANVVNAAVGVTLEEFCDRRVIAQRLDELDFGIGQRDEHGDSISTSAPEKYF